MRRRIGRLLALVVVAAMVMTGCAGIPTSGPVRAGLAGGESPDLGVDFVPLGPEPGDSPTEIVRGFLAAGNGSHNDFATARLFLAESFAPRWEPDAGVLVYQGSADASLPGENTVSMRVQPVATVDDTGHLVERSSDPAQDLSFEVVQEKGEWRISAAADGIVLLDAIFDQAYAAHALYYLDPTRKYLVPDLRWFASRESISTRIVSTLLSGPSSWLSQAVTSAFPEGTQLAVDSVPVTNSRASVELTPEILQASDADRTLMLAQLESSLRTVTSISSVTILVNQQELAVTRAVGNPIRNPLVDPRPLVLADGQFGYLTDAGVFPIDGLGQRIVQLGPSAVMLSASRSTAAVLTPTGAWQLGVTGPPTLMDDRPAQVAPVLDGQGHFWSVSNESATPVRASTAAGGIEFSLPWLGGARIVSLDLSRDGTRALILARGASGPLLVVVGVLRDGPEPIGLGEPLFLAAGTGTAVDAVWVNELDVASLTVTESGAGVVLSQSIGGTTQRLTGLVAPVSLAAGNRLDAVQALTADGAVLIPRGTRWLEVRGNVSLLATQYP